ncbi:hypothetical protein [Absidia glauca]|uniref:Uncharacterized protein n=1 Tax=Absidia glauca TaxID=4829 RepID=A0A163J0D5_ABSGL|nr:hypothetical protein [Absidia glauca]
MAERKISRQLGQHLTGVENMFFQVEHVRRLMTICSIWIFSQRLDTTLVLASLENLCSHYPRFCLVPKHGSRTETAIWTRPPRTWKPKDQLVFHTLTTPSTLCLQKYIASQYVQPFDPDKPLWQIHVIAGLKHNQTAILWKAHHSISDGIGIMKAVFATTTSLDPLAETYRQQKLLEERQAKDTNDRISSQQQHRPGTFKIMQWIYWLIWGWYLFISIIQQLRYELWTLSLLVTPLIRLIQRRLFWPFTPSKDTFDYDGDQTQGKLIAWTDDLARKDIQKVQHQHPGSTLNDVMLLVFERTVQRYTQDRNMHSHTPLRIVIPLSLRPPSDWSMDNKVTGNIVGLEAGISLQQVHRRMMLLKRSLLPAVMYYGPLQHLLRYFPFIMVPRCIQHWYADLPHAIFSNIPGPSVPTFFAGQEIIDVHALPPQAGKGCISVGLVSYGDSLNLTVLTDDHPDYPDLANILCKLFVAEFKTVLQESGQAPSSSCNR